MEKHYFSTPPSTLSSSNNRACPRYRKNVKNNTCNCGPMVVRRRLCILRIYQVVFHDTCSIIVSCGLDKWFRANSSVESFKPNDTKSTPTTLRLNFKQPGISSPVSSERQGSVKSILSSPTMSFMLSGKCTELHGTPPGYDMSEGINSKSYRAITFTKAKGKSLIRHVYSFHLFGS